jgi:hypothetical protein
MIGHQQIISARRKGKKSPFVFVRFGERPSRHYHDFDHPEKQIAYGFTPTVYVEENELSDLRFLIGIDVDVSSQEWTDEYLDFLDRATKAKPRQIIASASDNAMMIWRGTEWEVYQCQC